MSWIDAGSVPDVAYADVYDFQVAGKWAFDGKLEDISDILEEGIEAVARIDPHRLTDGEDAEADARRDAAKAALDEARARLAQCSVASPIDGIVLARFESQGQFVSAAVPTVLLEIADDRSLAINAEIDEARLSELCLGQQASVSVPGQGEDLSASVARIAPKVAFEPTGAQRQGQAQGRVAVSLDLARQDTKLRVGQAVTVRFEPCRR
jgi:multidrug resistance efflux pump